MIHQPDIFNLQEFPHLCLVTVDEGGNPNAVCSLSASISKMSFEGYRIARSWLFRNAMHSSATNWWCEFRSLNSWLVFEPDRAALECFSWILHKLCTSKTLEFCKTSLWIEKPYKCPKTTTYLEDNRCNERYSFFEHFPDLRLLIETKMVLIAVRHGVKSIFGETTRNRNQAIFGGGLHCTCAIDIFLSTG